MKTDDNLLTNVNLENLNLKDFRLLLEIIDILHEKTNNDEIEVI